MGVIVKAVLVITITSSLALLLGCSPGGSAACHKVCERYNQCGVADRSVDVECKHFCPEVDEFNDRMEDRGFGSCRDPYNAHLSCWEANIGEICNSDFADCADSGDAWVACMEDYCNAVVLGVDQNGDGTVDASEGAMDLNGDGKVDGYDVNGDGTVDREPRCYTVGELGPDSPPAPALTPF